MNRFFLILCFTVLWSCGRDEASVESTVSSTTQTAGTTRADTRPAPELITTDPESPAPAVVTAEEEPETDSMAAVEVIRGYYSDISRRDYESAWRRWGATGPPNLTRDEFIQGFAQTRFAQVQTGAPSRLEPAAGSRYVEVPVRVTVTLESGTVQNFQGAYTMTRSVIEGGDPIWRIQKAVIREVNGAR